MRKIVSFVLLLSIVFTIFPAPKDANAYMGILDASLDPLTGLTTGSTAVGTWSGFGMEMEKLISDKMASMLVVVSKVAALLAVQKITQAIIGKGGGGVVYDWNDYLYISPQQRAMAQMNSFFNTVSAGRLSSLNYEGVGPNYDAYLVAQARQAISGQMFRTNLQEQVSHPSQAFANGNMKGLMTYMQCANNPACYTLVASSKYEETLKKEQEIAKLSQKDGILPVKKNGKIIQPAAIVASALTQIDQLGTQVIMNAEAKKVAELGAAELQIATGATINIAARSFNYMLADSKGKEEIQAKNDKFPFSLNYSLNTGFGISAGGVNASLGGVGAVGAVQIGNTCATGATIIDPAHGAVVVINGKKYSCTTKGEITGTAPSISATLPTETCANNNGCNNLCSALPGCVGPLVCQPTTKKCIKATQ